MHGQAGIYFKYDVSALKVVIKEDRENIASFLIRLCAVIAGIVVICGFLNSIAQAVLGNLFDYLLPQYKEPATTTEKSLFGKNVPDQIPPVASHVKTNLLLTNDMLQDAAMAPNQFIPFK